MKAKIRFRIARVVLFIMVMVFGLIMLGCPDPDFGSYYTGGSSGGGYNSGSGSGVQTLSYTFYNESSFPVTVSLTGVTTFVLLAGDSRTVRNVPDGIEIKIIGPAGHTVDYDWDYTRTSCYIYVY